MITPLEVFSPLLLDGLDDLALGLFNDSRLDGVVFRRDVRVSLDGVILGAEFLDLVQFDDIAQVDITEAIQDNDIVLGDQVRSVLNLGDSIVAVLAAKQVDE